MPNTTATRSAARSSKKPRHRAPAPKSAPKPKPEPEAVVQAPVRRKLVSPVTAPLTFRPPRPLETDASGELTPEERARVEAKAAKRRHEDELWAAYHQSGAADDRNRLWVHYQSLVRYIAERQKTKLPECVDVMDLLSAGNLGLQDAIQKFDPSKGVRFETYCVPRIRGAMLDSIRACDWVPRLIRNKHHLYARTIRELGSELGREPVDEEIAARLDMDLDKLNKLRRELDVKAQISLDGGTSDNSDERDLLRLEMLEDREEDEPTRELQREEIREIALRGLHPNERAVVEQYYFNGRSMKQIGDLLDLSESRICQIHAQVIEVLRKKFRSYQNSVCF
ncbi:MAG: FliA/WhiG family RNA polymerase sigma factor [Planctomycetota bacterium]|nr:FliA/WhiG family RNA polymerase sigma factor [Planctomycetota bacterium]